MGKSMDLRKTFFKPEISFGLLKKYLIVFNINDQPRQLLEFKGSMMATVTTMSFSFLSNFSKHSSWTAPLRGWID